MPNPCQQGASSAWEGPLAAKPPGVTLCSRGVVTTVPWCSRRKCLLIAGRRTLGAGLYAPILPGSPVPKGPRSPLNSDRAICEFSFCTWPVMHGGRVLSSGECAGGTAGAWRGRLELLALLAVGLNCCLTAGKVSQTLCCHSICQARNTSASPSNLLCDGTCAGSWPLTLLVLPFCIACSVSLPSASQ